MDSLRIAAAMAGGGRLGDVEVNNQQSTSFYGLHRHDKNYRFLTREAGIYSTEILLSG